ncbi:MAG TPA: gamma-glutamylcyclotransferase family protein [Opitutaceae bacterium]|nr:gamma-glutamylcyclotransferase family protein [Opitutaceae bacterium]
MDPRPATDLLFTYGTLRRAAGHAAHRLLADSAEIVGHGTVRGRLYDAGEFPVLVPDPLGPAVTGEVYRVFGPPSVFIKLDHYEGFEPESPDTSEFRRDFVTVHMSDGRAVTAWAYVYQRPLFDLHPIPHGDYARYLRENSGGAAPG